MVTGTHPEDIDLFDYVEGDMPDARRAELEVHLASCARCAEQVARVRDGRDALRESQILQLSKPRRDAIFLGLPPQRTERRRSFSLKPVLAALATAGVAAAITVAIINADGTGGNEESAGGAAALTAGAAEGAGETGGGGGSEGPAQDRAAKAGLLFAAGPADGVAAELRRKGFDAEVVGNRVEVRGATRAEVKQALGQALSERRDGDVRIVIVH